MGDGNESRGHGAGCRCAAADDKDPTACEGPLTAVTVVTADGTEITGCVRHSARQLASLQGARLHPMAALLPWAVDVYCRAAELPPFAWQVGL
ncbi:hypothetical protein BJP40_20115 [Streptomyces sp. CC53]|uniref:hypothetical protein n=1 Tax=unclassified Streptomyces TaxID=2593676 RepID=UPI0008DDF0D9|nr:MULTISPECIES: hypothetical protein [unclassified Streptomyces]OII64642.1 hypothetical protein BJP40_20115 [Streptomyces sp. CC53]